jgi:hypothetical protein
VDWAVEVTRRMDEGVVVRTTLDELLPCARRLPIERQPTGTRLSAGCSLLGGDTELP